MATTEKMLPPGMMPGKEEIEKYTRLYADPDFSLSGLIESFDSSVLSEDYERTFCKRYPYYTLVGNDEDVKGWEWDPLVHRTDLMKISHRGDMEEFERAEERFRVQSSLGGEKLEKAYKTLRSKFSTAIGSKVCLDYLKNQTAAFTSEELEKQRQDFKKWEEERNKEWKKQQERQEYYYQILSNDPDLEDLEYYSLTEEEVKELKALREEMMDGPEPVPEGYVSEYHYIKGTRILPIKSVKLRMLRKALKINQRDFAKRIGYPNVNKYAKLEQGELADIDLNIYYAFPDDMIRAVVDATYCNPYWLEDDLEDSIYMVDEEQTADNKEDACGNDNTNWDYPMFVTAKVIREWWVRKS